MSERRVLRGQYAYRALLPSCVLLLVTDCTHHRDAVAPAARALPPEAIPVRFTDVTASAGISFRHENGADGRKFYPESIGSGCAFFDYDNDGWPDLLFVNGTGWPDAPHRRHATMRLYRNRRNGTFEDVTHPARLDVEMYGIGCAAGDFDDDGFEDLYVTCAYGPSRLFRNGGDGRFEDVTASAGVDNHSQFATSAAWFDYDRDGRLDLFVCNYIRWSPAGDLRCELRPGIKEYCTPQSYDGLPCRLYRNLGGGRFEDRSGASGIARSVGKSMGVVVCDYNGDNWPDLIVTNDTEPTFLFRNNGDGTFGQVGMESGLALSESGKPKAGMGIDAADVLNNGTLAVATSNFSGESLSLFSGGTGGFFNDESATAGLTESSRSSLGWGLFFFDFDLDGWQDLFAANGHIYSHAADYQAGVAYAERPLLYRNDGKGAFQEIGSSAGTGFSPIVARGAAYGNFDNDGDLDIAINVNGGAARLIRNDGGNRHNWLCLSLEGIRCNRDAVGAVVRVSAGSVVQTRRVPGGGSYASQSDRRLTFGLGDRTAAESVEILWPTGDTQRLGPLQANQRLRIRQDTPAAAAPATPVR